MERYHTNMCNVAYRGIGGNSMKIRFIVEGGNVVGYSENINDEVSENEIIFDVEERTLKEYLHYKVVDGIFVKMSDEDYKELYPSVAEQLSDINIAQQRITELELELIETNQLLTEQELANIETNQHLTDLELIVLEGGASNV